MSRMIDMIRQSAVPANVMRSAAMGALAVPPAEMIEILVLLTKNPVFAEQAKMTLAGWDEAASLAVAGDVATPWEVLEYMVAPANRRPKLVPALLENPTVREARLVEMAQAQSVETLTMMLASARVRGSTDVLHALATNPHLPDEGLTAVKAALAALGESAAELAASLESSGGEQGKSEYEIEHANEIQAEEGKSFELVGGTADDQEAIAAPEAPAKEPEAAAVAVKKAEGGDERERISTLQKIARLSVGQRVQLAMKGNKDERFILIRDGSKVVSHAVLESPKLSDAEAETYAGMKNVQESVLRAIASKRKFMKSYAVIRALANNPRCPLDLSLTLLNHLMVHDLKNLGMNKNISETLRKMASKLHRQKSAPPGAKKTD